MAEQKPASEVPLSSEAQEAKELMQQQLLRKMANKMMAEAIEEERQRRIKQEEEANEDAVRRKAFDQLITVQEDLIHTLNLMKVTLQAARACIYCLLNASDVRTHPLP